jgi:hypothetical protein
MTNYALQSRICSLTSAFPPNTGVRSPPPTASSASTQRSIVAPVWRIFPNSAGLLRLSTAVMQDQHDEWQDGRRHFSQQSMRLLNPQGPPLITNPLTEGIAA